MKRLKAFTMIELLVVVLILGLLSTIAVGVFTNQVERARYAAAKSTISAIELAVNRYQIDLGVFPPSLSASAEEGCGWMQLALMHSLSGSSQNTSGTLWAGPYLTVRQEQLGNFSGVPLEQLSSINPADVQILDPWRSPYRFVRSGPGNDSYATNGGTRLPSNHPFATTEVYYNPSTFQIASKGSDNESPNPPEFGRGNDDVTNFGQ